MPQRPNSFTIKRNHPLASRMFVASLGAHAGSTRYHDSSAYGNTGAFTNMEMADLVWDSSLNRFAINCDGSNEYVLETTIPGWMASTYTTGLTISAWIAHTGTLARYCICGSLAASATQGFQLNVNSDNAGSVSSNKVVLACIRSNSSTDISSSQSDTDDTLSSGSFTHVCAVASPGLLSAGITIYVNGIAKGMTASGVNVAGSINDLTYGMTIGARNVAGTIALYYPGKIADLMIHGRVLSTPEIGMLADRSNVMLSGMIQNPRRKWWPIPSTAVFKPYWANQATQVAL